MSTPVTTRPYTLYLGGPIPDGTELHENYLIGTTDQDYASAYGGYLWIMGPNEYPGYVVTGINGDKPTFWRSDAKTEESFLRLVNNIYGTLGSLTPFLSASDARIWLAENGYYFTESDGNGISGIIIGAGLTSPTWNYVIMDYDTETETVFDFGIDKNQWFLQDRLPLQGKGYLVIFNNGGEDKYLYWIDSHGNILDTYNPNKPSLNYDTLDGKWLVVNDDANGVLKYSNGSNVFTYNYDGTSENNSWEWNFDSTTLNSSFLFKKILDSDPDTTNLYVIKEDGSINFLTSYDHTVNSYYSILYTNSNYITLLISSIDTGYFTDITMIHDTTLSSIQEIPILTSGYDNYTIQGYSTNNIYMVFWSNSDVNLDYLIINYDSTTQILINTTHIRTDNYSTLNGYSNSMYWQSSIGPDDNAFLVFYHYTGDYTRSCLNVTYMDIVTLVKGQTDIISYSYQNSGVEDKTACISDIKTGNSFFLYGDNGDGNVDVTVIASDGTPAGLIICPWDQVGNINVGVFGNYYYLITWEKSGDGGAIFIINESGSVVTANEFLAISSNNLPMEVDDNMLLYLDSNNLWLFNNESESFQQFDPYNDIETASYYFVGEQRRNPYMIAFNNSTFVARVFGKNSHSPEFSLPPFSNDGYLLQMGENYFMYNFDNGVNNTSQLYDLDGNLLSSIDTSFNFQSLGIIGDRAFIINDDPVNKTTHFDCIMLTPTGTNTITLLGVPDTLMPDDIIWWWYN